MSLPGRFGSLATEQLGIPPQPAGLSELQLYSPQVLVTQFLSLNWSFLSLLLFCCFQSTRTCCIECLAKAVGKNTRAAYPGLKPSSLPPAPRFHETARLLCRPCRSIKTVVSHCVLFGQEYEAHQSLVSHPGDATLLPQIPLQEVQLLG